ncbi:receptor-like serine/threonine-protein kinase SD1-7 isoform X2 [Humulus lupulus]|uniref:receptor-like serine/threonine-protein kinase SD1-7 isoform X2 n=1 Tax=Humulus lupulus TaxID=3486 RepID=UPI002B40BFD7|nr:receptor-like serine/threonine-protein kinase SD1-7 isoform X2 [Humulus lupulus]
MSYRPVILVIQFLCLFVKTNFSLGTGGDTISANQSLSGFSTIVSAGGVFVLGFFSPGNNENYYVGIWYQVDPSRSVVWIANREKPVSYYSQLRISDGNLVLFNEAEASIWSTNVNSTSSSVQAVLRDDGNLVLIDGSNRLKILWQSFDHPSHTFLPGNKIGYNNITKTHRVLTSWKNSTDPSRSLYTFQLNETDNSYILLWNKSISYWSSGPWNGHNFRSIPGTLEVVYNLRFESNKNESYFTYSVKNTTMISRVFLDVSGQLKRYNWLSASKKWDFGGSHPSQQCEVYSFCGAYSLCDEKSLPFCRCLTGFHPKFQSEWDLKEYSNGCIRKTELQCRDDSADKVGGDIFLEIPYITLPENNQSLRAGTIQDCESKCLRMCSCIAYAHNSSGCSFWTEDLVNLKQLNAHDSNSKSLHIRLAASEFQDHKNKTSKFLKSKLLHVMLGTMAAAVLVLSIACSVYYQRRKKQTKSQGDKKKILEKQEVLLYDTEKQIANFMKLGQFREDERKGIDVPFVALESIIVATDNFSDANKLGKGGFGSVYKGKFPGGQEIAIKRLSSGSGQGLEEFKNEVTLIAKLQHRNLVRLLGYCVEKEEKLLLYEYMPNKSLNSFIFDQTLCVRLNWELRFDIILGIARGLLYLHHDSRLRIIHRDLKTSNVLLDEEMIPKISDFGLARIFGGKQTEASTRRVVGTYGYMAPEYALDGLFSIKSDVFSFGVMLLEMAWKLWKDNKVWDLVDATLSASCNANELMRCVNVGLLCVQEDPSDRPTMPNVVFMLGNETASLSNPKQPAFISWKSPFTSTSSSKPLSVNELTTSIVQGR